MTKLFWSLFGVQVALIFALLVYNLTGENPNPELIKEVISLILANWFLSSVVWVLWFVVEET